MAKSSVFVALLSWLTPPFGKDIVDFNKASRFIYVLLKHFVLYLVLSRLCMIPNSNEHSYIIDLERALYLDKLLAFQYVWSPFVTFLSEQSQSGSGVSPRRNCQEFGGVARREETAPVPYSLVQIPGFFGLLLEVFGLGRSTDSKHHFKSKEIHPVPRKLN